MFSIPLQTLRLAEPCCTVYPTYLRFRKRVRKVNILLVVADNDRIVRVSRNLNENDNGVPFRQPLLQCVKTSAKGFCPVPTAMKNIRNTVHRSEAKRSRQFRKQIFAVRLFPEVPQNISGGICRAFSVRLEIDTVFWIFTEK